MSLPDIIINLGCVGDRLSPPESVLMFFLDGGQWQESNQVNCYSFLTTHSLHFMFLSFSLTISFNATSFKWSNVVWRCLFQHHASRGWLGDGMESLAIVEPEGVQTLVYPHLNLRCFQSGGPTLFQFMSYFQNNQVQKIYCTLHSTTHAW